MFTSGRGTSYRLVGRYAMILFVVVSVVALITYFLQNTTPSSMVDTTPAPTATTPSRVSVLPPAEPIELVIPKIALEASFTEPLGIDTAGEVEVPTDFGLVGWYKYSPTPGELGPAVILGHVQSRQGPAVFSNLEKLESGDTIIIKRADGTSAVFMVTATENYEQRDFPTASVYGNIDHAGLRLITCSGTFDEGTERYTHNVVVYAELVP